MRKARPFPQQFVPIATIAAVLFAGVMLFAASEIPLGNPMLVPVFMAGIADIVFAVGAAP